MADSPRPRILCISFSDINGDSRVLRQLGVLARHGDVTTLSYGTRPVDADHHIAIDGSLPSLPQTVPGVIKLALRRYETVQFESPAMKAAISALGDAEFDIVVANEARALPLAFLVRGNPRIWCDLHEWAPEERTHVLSWRLLVSPFMRWICGRYLPSVDASTTINGSIAELYRHEFGIDSEIVRNAIPFRADIAPSPVSGDRIRLVHSGGAVPGRNIETIIDAVDVLGARFSLDLYLIPSRQGDSYWRSLMDRITASERTTLHAPVAPAMLPVVLNAYDLGVFVLPPHTPNHRLMLPNKFFDFVQARLGLVFGPSVETDRLIAENGLGIVTDGYSPEALVRALQGLTAEDVAAFKCAADRAAEPLSSEADIAVEEAIMTRLARR